MEPLIGGVVQDVIFTTLVMTRHVSSVWMSSLCSSGRYTLFIPGGGVQKLVRVCFLATRSLEIAASVRTLVNLDLCKVKRRNFPTKEHRPLYRWGK